MNGWSDMVPICSADTSPQLTQIDRSLLLQLAQRSISYGMECGKLLPLDPASYPTALQQKRASFVTLNRYSRLRGCIGHLNAIQPLAADVNENAFAAAFRDPRFNPLTNAELEGLEMHISVLSSAVPLVVATEKALLEKLRPGIDGVILKLGRRQGTFLPSVWESLPDADAFLAHLKMKAGLPRDYWSDQIEVLRYQTESFGSPF